MLSIIGLFSFCFCHFRSCLVWLKTCTKMDISPFQQHSGPILIISHDVQFTEILSEQESEKTIRSRFTKLGMDCSAYKKIIYHGSRPKQVPGGNNSRRSSSSSSTTTANISNGNNSSEDEASDRLAEIIRKETEDEHTRIKRPLESIYNAIEVGETMTSRSACFIS